MGNMYLSPTGGMYPASRSLWNKRTPLGSAHHEATPSKRGALPPKAPQRQPMRDANVNIPSAHTAKEPVKPVSDNTSKRPSASAPVTLAVQIHGNAGVEVAEAESLAETIEDASFVPETLLAAPPARAAVAVPTSRITRFASPAAVILAHCSLAETFQDSVAYETGDTIANAPQPRQATASPHASIVLDNPTGSIRPVPEEQVSTAAPSPRVEKTLVVAQAPVQPVARVEEGNEEVRLGDVEPVPQAFPSPDPIRPSTPVAEEEESEGYKRDDMLLSQIYCTSSLRRHPLFEQAFQQVCKWEDRVWFEEYSYLLFKSTMSPKVVREPDSLREAIFMLLRWSNRLVQVRHEFPSAATEARTYPSPRAVPVASPPWVRSNMLPRQPQVPSVALNANAEAGPSRVRINPPQQQPQVPTVAGNANTAEGPEFGGKGKRKADVFDADGDEAGGRNKK